MGKLMAPSKWSIILKIELLQLKWTFVNNVITIYDEETGPVGESSWDLPSVAARLKLMSTVVCTCVLH